MNKYKIVLLLLILLSLSILASAAPDICQAQFTIGSMNQTPNQTACTATVNATFTGGVGTPADVTNIGGLSATVWDFTIPQGVNGTPGTPGAPGAPGAPGGAGAPGAPGPNIVQANVTETNITGMIKGDGNFVFPAIPDLDFVNNSIFGNQTFFLTDASRPLTAEKVRRDVDNDLLSLYGGNTIAGGTGGILSLFGKDAINPNAVEIVVGDGGVGNTLVTGWVGGTTPRMDMNGFNISSLLDPIADQDAATRNWVLVQVGNITISGYIKSDGSIPFTGSQSMGNNNLTNVTTVAPGDAVCKTYVDTAIAGVGSSGINGTWYILLDPVSTFVGINNPSPRWALDVVGIINATNIRTNESFGSVSLGVTAGKGNSGNYSTLIGEGAGYPVGAFRQTATGYSAGQENTGNYQTATGYGAGQQNTGTSQTATGYYAGRINTGNDQTATGYGAGQQNTGTSQTATGLYAGQNNTGTSQTTTGYYAGRSNTGNDQTATGAYAGHSNTGTSQTTTGYYAGRSNTGNDQTATGYGAGQQNTGTSQTATGLYAGHANTGTSQTATGLYAGRDNTGTSQTATGAYAGRLNTGSNATEIGVYSGYQNSGANLVAIGNFSGYQNTGNNVTAIGSNAGRGNAIHNIFILMQREANSVALIQGNFTSGQVQFPNYGTGVAVFDAFGNISSNTSYATTTYIDAVNTSMRNNVSANFAPIVGGKVPTVNLGGAGADATTYLRGDQTWATPATGGGTDPTSNLTTLILSDFYEATVNTLPQLEGAAISSGTIGTVATDSQHPGVIYMRDSTTANGGYRFGCVGTQLIGGGEVYEVVFQPVGVRTGQSVQMGWSDTAAAGTAPVDGVWFNITGTGAAITLRGNTSSNSVRSGTSTTYTPTTATWYRGTIEINSAASLVTYRIYNDATGATLWTSTVSTNIPTGAGRDTSPCIIVAQSSTDAAADILRLDYTRWATTKALQR